MERQKEMKSVYGIAIDWSILQSTHIICPLLVTFVTLVAYIFMNPGELITAEKIFACMAIVKAIQIPMVLMPKFFMETVKLAVSIKRINKFLGAKDNSKNARHETCSSSSNAIELSKLTLSWSDDIQEAALFKDFNLKVKKGTLVAVLGKVGSGKSSLLSGMLGEMNLHAGEVKRDGSIAYVPQQAWIQNMSLMSNIIFGKQSYLN